MIASSALVGDRWPRVVLFASTGLACWLGMQAVHELGHVLGALLTGGTVERVVLHPFTISRTDLGHNPNPALVAWAGPIGGILIPLVLWGLAKVLLPSGTFFLRFFAGFCMLANGLYIGGGSFVGVGDCGDLLRAGESLWLLWLFGVISAPTGLFLWHRLGPAFGIGPKRQRVTWQKAMATTAIAGGLFAAGLACGA